MFSFSVTDHAAVDLGLPIGINNGANFKLYVRCSLCSKSEMVSFHLARLAAVAFTFFSCPGAYSVPTETTALEGLGQQARDVLARATPAAPHWVVYGDQYVSGTTGPPATSAITV